MAELKLHGSMEKIKEIREVQDYDEANMLLDGDWVLLSIFFATQKQFKVMQTENGERICPYDKLVKIYTLGRIKKTGKK